jgi:chorismate synthase
MDGRPSSLAFSAEDVQMELDRRRPGQSRASTARPEEYTLRDHQGGWRASAWETVGRVAAEVVTEILLLAAGVEVVAYMKR